MKKNYYMLFGSKKRTVTELGFEMTEMLDLDFAPHESSYVGEYLKYCGLYADYLTIEPNLVDSEVKEKGFLEYKTLIYLSFVNGKNKDRKSRTNHIRRVLINHLIGVDYLRERILSDGGEILEEVSNDIINELNKNAKKNFI